MAYRLDVPHPRKTGVPSSFLVVGHTFHNQMSIIKCYHLYTCQVICILSFTKSSL